MKNEPDSFAEHPLFRALVLMGGALALGCGGVAQREGYAAENGGAYPSPATSPPSAGSGGAASDGATNGKAIAGSAGASTLGQAGKTSGDGRSPTDPACPTAQWDCSALPSSCSRDLSPGMVALGCFCNAARPVDANDCAANESLFCQRGIAAFEAETWDYAVHYQCSCVASPPVNDIDAATASCLQLSPGQSRATMVAILPASQKCDGTVCTATSADVLRQDGIMCGCADIGLI